MSKLVRHYHPALLEWKMSLPYRLPLLMLGARQVGKTHLVEDFGKAHFPKVHIFNFEKHHHYHSVFQKDLDPTRILSELSILARAEIEKEDLVFFDEIQQCPPALTSLKYFAEDLPHQALIAAGSLLGVTLSDSSFPVGKVQEMRIYPLTFSEFLASLDSKVCSAFMAAIQDNSISESLHSVLWDYCLKYCFCGGMPAVVHIFARHHLLSQSAMKQCRTVQQSLITQYMNDFAKHSGKVNAMHLERVFRGIAAQLAASVDDSVKRFRFSGVVPGVSQYSRLASAFDWLERASLIQKVPLLNTIPESLITEAKENFFKAYLFDIGILGALIGIQSDAFLNPHMKFIKGFLAENFVCQELAAQGFQIFAWSAPGAFAEIEFIIQSPTQGIVPIEVKSGNTSKAKSLASYIRRYNPQEAWLFGNTGFRKDGITRRCPMYTVGEMEL